MAAVMETKTLEEKIFIYLFTPPRHTGWELRAPELGNWLFGQAKTERDGLVPLITAELEKLVEEGKLVRRPDLGDDYYQTVWEVGHGGE